MNSFFPSAVAALKSAAPSSVWSLTNLYFMFAWFLAFVDAKLNEILETPNNADERLIKIDYETKEKKKREMKKGKDCDETRVFVTGYSSGIGFEVCVKLLLEFDWISVVLPTRKRYREDEDAGDYFRENAREEIKKVCERMRERCTNDTSDKEFDSRRIVVADIGLDVVDIVGDRDMRERSSRYFAKEKVDCVVHCAAECNAENEMVGYYYDRECACNVLGPIVLTDLWRSAFDGDDDSANASMKRVVFVGSFTHRARGVCTKRNVREWLKRLNGCTDVKNEKFFETLACRYAVSKFIITAYVLGKMKTYYNDRIFKPPLRVSGGRKVRAFVVDPGLCRTNLTRTWPAALRLLYEIPMRMLGLIEHPSKGAERIVRKIMASNESETFCNHDLEFSDARAYSKLARDQAMQNLVVKEIDFFLSRADK